MADDGATGIDRRKIRIGLAVIAGVVVVAVVLAMVIEAAAGKAVMVAIALTALTRMFLLARSLRDDPPGGR
jgi:hypothetical protein